MGNDFPVVRYADILLSKAEALNELTGPTAAAIELINQAKLPSITRFYFRCRKAKLT